MDTLLYGHPNSKLIYALTRKKCRSTLLVKFLNRFGENGGFKLLVDKINQRGDDTMGLETLFYYLDCLSNCHIMINKIFVNEYLEILAEAVKGKVLSAT